jgi:hypothetical protein
MSLIPYAAVLAVLVLAILGLLVYRKKVAGSVDQSLHVTQGGDLSRQAAVVSKLDQIDRWGKILTVIAVLYALAVLAMFLYKNFTQPPLG